MKIPYSQATVADVSDAVTFVTAGLCHRRRCADPWLPLTAGIGFGVLRDSHRRPVRSPLPAALTLALLESPDRRSVPSTGSAPLPDSSFCGSIPENGSPCTAPIPETTLSEQVSRAADGRRCQPSPPSLTRLSIAIPGSPSESPMDEKGKRIVSPIDATGAGASGPAGPHTGIRSAQDGTSPFLPQTSPPRHPTGGSDGSGDGPPSWVVAATGFPTVPFRHRHHPGPRR